MRIDEEILFVVFFTEFSIKEFQKKIKLHFMFDNKEDPSHNLNEFSFFLFYEFVLNVTTLLKLRIPNFILLNRGFDHFNKIAI